MSATSPVPGGEPARTTADVDDRAGALRRAITYLLDALDPGDLEYLLRQFYSRGEFEDAVATRAGEVVDLLAETAEPVEPDEYAYLVAAMLTWGRESHGVHQNKLNAANKFRWYRSHREIPPEMLARMTARDEALLPHIAATVALRARYTEERAVREPAMFFASVLGTVLEAKQLDVDAALPEVDPVFDRADALLHASYDSGGAWVSDLDANAGLAVGNADFLLQLAATRVALEERLSDASFGDAVAEVEVRLGELLAQLRSTARRPARPWRRSQPNEPDALLVLPELAAYLGDAVSPDAGTKAGKAYVHFTPWLRRLLLQDDDTTPVADFVGPPGSAPPPWGGGEPQRPDGSLVRRDHVMSWLVWAVFDAVETDEHELVTEWLRGRRRVDLQDGLVTLVGCIHAAARVLVAVPDEPPPPPVTLDWKSYRSLVEFLSEQADGDVAEVEGRPLPLGLGRLPELWSRRNPVVEFVAEQLALALGGGFREAARATLVAGFTVHSPKQGVRDSRDLLPPRCCRASAEDGPVCCERRSRERLGERVGEPPYLTDICPERPWQEAGYVESYATLARFAGYPTGDAVRQQLARYSGPAAWIIHRRRPKR